MAISQKSKPRSSPKAKLRTLTAGQLLALNIPRRKYLLRPVLREQESMLLYAQTGAGKSLFALSFAIAVAGGGRFLGWKCEAPTRVLYVDGEMNVEDTQQRLAGLLEGAKEVDADSVMNNLLLFPRQYQKGTDWFPSITDAKGVAHYRQMIADARIGLVIFDNLSTLGEVEDENSASSFNGLTQTLLDLKTQNVATVLVHHAGKSAQQSYRGSSRLAATFEVILKLDCEGAADWEPVRSGDEVIDHDVQPAKFLTDFEKGRSGIMPAAVVAQLDSRTTLSGEVLVWTYEASNNSRLAEIKTGLEAGRWKSQKEIAADLGVNAATISRDIRAAIRQRMWPEGWHLKQMQEVSGRPSEF